MTIQQAIQTNLEWFVKEVETVMDAKNITDTGRAKKSLKIDNSTSKSYFFYEVLGVDYIEFLNSGRGAGNRPPIKALQSWVKSKLGISDERQSLGVAFAVANKIAQEGTEILKNPNKGLQIENLAFQFQERLKKDLKDAATFKMNVKLDEYTRKFAREKLFK